jgi:hypothetical protein
MYRASPRLKTPLLQILKDIRMSWVHLYNMRLKRSINHNHHRLVLPMKEVNKTYRVRLCHLKERVWWILTKYRPDSQSCLVPAGLRFLDPVTNNTQEDLRLPRRGNPRQRSLTNSSKTCRRYSSIRKRIPRVELAKSPPSMRRGRLNLD